MIKKIIKAVNSVFGNFVYKKPIPNQKELVIQKISLLFNMIYILLSQHIMQKNI